jgi:hypothetical protein
VPANQVALHHGTGTVQALHGIAPVIKGVVFAVGAHSVTGVAHHKASGAPGIGLGDIAAAIHLADDVVAIVNAFTQFLYT